MSKVTLTIGIPASGKTTWAVAEAKKTGAMIVCRDDVRRMLGLRWNEQENKVTALCYVLIEGLLRGGYDVIVADTNINARNRLKLKDFCVSHGAWVQYKFFPISISEAMRRDRSREASVGPAVVETMQKNLLRQFKDGTLDHF